MTGKKTKQADLERRRLYHFTIGLVLAVSVVFVAFEWKYKESVLVDLGEVRDDFADVPEIKRTVIEPPKPPVVQPKIIPVDNEEEIEVDIDFVIDVEVDSPVLEMENFEEPEPEEEKDFWIHVEEQPSFPCCVESFYQFVSKELNYPRQAVNRGVDGKVFVQFVVNKDGSLTDVEVIKGIGAGCDEEAVRVLKNAPRWNPGKQRGKPVRVRMVIPIIFRLQ
ncbi:MAG: energy transducer TonB [Cyclobacteriaceae bacterium]